MLSDPRATTFYDLSAPIRISSATNAATELRKAFGLEAAQLTLGHASAQITDAIYAERDRAKMIEIMQKIG